MNTFNIPQSPNWYKSNVITMDQRGKLMAYGSRTTVVLVNGLESNSVYDLQYNHLVNFTKKNRIIAVSFSHKTDNYEDAYFLASIDNYNIYVWEVKSLALKYLHTFPKSERHQSVAKITLTDMTWLYKCLKLVAISDCGALYGWDIQTLRMIKYQINIKTKLLTLSACPHKKNIIAIGCKEGYLIVYDLTDCGQILHILRCHLRHILSLSWCPVPYNPLSSDQSTEPLLLASTASDQTGLNIWRAGLDMSNEAIVLLPDKPLRETIFRNNTHFFWSCIKWVKPTLIIISSCFGEIIKVEFRPEQNFKPIITLISDSHNNVIFSIACSFESIKPYLWSSCMGGKLIRTPLFDTTNTDDLPFSIPTINGFVHCFSHSPVNSSNFAFGVGDGKIYCWNLSNKQQFEMTALNSCSLKVLSLAYHPKNENLIAFGTDDGRIGMFNLKRNKNKPKLLKTVISQPVNCLCWAPLPNTKNDDELIIYAVCGGEILIYNDTNICKNPRSLKEYTQFNDSKYIHNIPVYHIYMAWQPNYNIVAIGNANGSIYLLERDTFKLKHVVHSHFQSIECITWHPTRVTSDNSKESKYKNCFASSSNNIQIFELNDDSKLSFLVKLEGHTEKINDLAWSPHRNLWLLSCSNDMTAKIWDVEKSTLIGIYSKHVSAVLCGIFSPFDNDIVITGGSDSSIHSWRIKDTHNDLRYSTNNVLLNTPDEVIPHYNNINMWNQNLEDYLKNAIKKHTINDWMVAISPIISHEFWVNMCDAYARQLEIDGEMLKASTYLVGLKKFREAAMMLVNHNFFDEALFITLNQEIPSQEIISEIIKQWAQYNCLHGKFKEAAIQYLSIKDEINAIHCLTKVNQVNELKFAANLAKHLNEEIELSLVVNILIMEYFMHCKWNEAREFLDNHPKLVYLNMWVSVHKAMFELDPDITLKKIKNWICTTDNEDKSTIFDYILKNVDLNYDYYDKLVNIVGFEFTSDNSLLLQKTSIFIAGQLCLIALQYKKFKLLTIDSQKRLIKCFAVAIKYDIYKLPWLVMRIFPEGPLVLNLYTMFESNNTLLKTIQAHLCYICFLWLKLLYEDLNKQIKRNKTNERKKNIIYDEIIILTRRFQHLFNNYKHYILDMEILYYFLAKEEIQHLNKLIALKSPVGSKVLSNECIKSPNSIEEIKYVGAFEQEKTIPLNNEIVESLANNFNKFNTVSNDKICALNNQESGYACKSYQNENMNNCDLVNTNGSSMETQHRAINVINPEKNSDFSNFNSLVNIKNTNCKREEIKYDGAFEQEKTIPVNNEIVESLANNFNKFNTVSNDKICALNNQESDYACKSYQNENMNNCDLVNTNGSSMETQHRAINAINPEKNSDFSNFNSLVNIKNKTCKRLMCIFVQNVISEFDKYNYLTKKKSNISDANLNITLKKKKLENFITEFENNRINCPNPFVFIIMLKNYFYTIN